MRLLSPQADKTPEGNDLEKMLFSVQEQRYKYEGSKALTCKILSFHKSCAQAPSSGIDCYPATSGTSTNNENIQRTAYKVANQ